MRALCPGRGRHHAHIRTPLGEGAASKRKERENRRFGDLAWTAQSSRDATFSLRARTITGRIKIGKIALLTFSSFSGPRNPVIHCLRLLRNSGATDSNTTAMEHCPSMQPWTRPAGEFTARLPLATPAASLSSSSRRWVSLCPRHKQMHIILDSLSAHKTTLVRKFLE